MNSKLIKGSLAGVACLALAAGGSTFAAWSDFQVDEGNSVGADILALTVDESTTMTFDDVKLAPGQERDLAFYVASRNGTTIDDADLTMTIQNLAGTENGCDSNSEAFAESGGVISDRNDQSAPCNDLNSGGEFAQQTLYYVQSKKASSAAACDTGDSPTRQSNKRLSLMNGVTVDLLGASDHPFTQGEGVCVLAHVFMPDNASQYGFAADNASQGDQATFDVRFDLTQVG